MNRYARMILPIAGMLLLIFYPKTALEGAIDGIHLCIHSVIPALFPFLVLSGMLTGALSGLSLLRPLEKLLHAPGGLLVCAFLGGYPVGAQCADQLYREGAITRSETRRLLAFCSNPGPSFLFGIAAAQFSDRDTGWLLWGVQILSALAVGLIIPGENAAPTVIKSSAEPMSRILRNSITAMAQICGWVVLFRVITAYLNASIFHYLPGWLQILSTGLLELTNGCTELWQIRSEAVRFLVASVMLSAGGICVLMQTASVTSSCGLGLYLPGKALQCLLSFLISVSIIRGVFFPVTVPVLALLVLRKIKKDVAIPRQMLYNQKRK